MLTWPAIFPKPTVNLGHSQTSGVIRSQMEADTYRVRQRYTGGSTLLALTWQLSDSQYETFRAIYAHTLSGGADWFLIDLPFGGNGLTECQARFAEEPTESHFGVLQWSVSAIVEVQSLSILTADLTAALDDMDYDLDAFEAAVAALTEVVETF